MLDHPLISFPLYKVAGYLLTPFLPSYLKRRVKRDKEDADRLSERYGITDISRPKGTLIWLHAASVGELVSAFSLLKTLKENQPTFSFLVTTGTVTSARMAAKHLDKDIIHQFAPLDSPVYVRNFLNHWQPDLVLWLESEFWPNQLLSIRHRKIPALLLNARMSDRSFTKWSGYPKCAKKLLSCFTGLSAQSPKDREKLYHLAQGREIYLPGNLKQAALPLPYLQEDFDHLKSLIGARKIITVASTHPTEEARILKCFRAMVDTIGVDKPLLIIVPRHPARGDDVRAEIEGADFSLSQRSRHEGLNQNTDVYLADTLGELGLFYALADIAFIGGSLATKIGGHNPVEAALLNCAIVYGPDMANFTAIAQELQDNDAAISCQNDAEIIRTLTDLIEGTDQCKDLSLNAKEWAVGQNQGILKRVETLILTHMKAQNMRGLR